MKTFSYTITPTPAGLTTTWITTSGSTVNFGSTDLSMVGSYIVDVSVDIGFPASIILSTLTGSFTVEITNTAPYFSTPLFTTVTLAV